jgi:hypothetical protein
MHASPHRTVLFYLPWGLRHVIRIALPVIRIDSLFSRPGVHDESSSSQLRQLSVTESLCSRLIQRELPHGQKYTTSRLQEVRQSNEIHSGEKRRTQVPLH